MKTSVILLVTLLSTGLIYAQSDFPKTWETKMDVENMWHSVKNDLSMVLVGDKKEIAMYDGNNGKQLWKFNFKEKLGEKTVDDWSYYWAMEGEPVEIVYQKNKTKTTIYLDSKTGNVNSNITESNLKSKNEVAKKKTRTKYATSAISDDNSNAVELTFLDKFLKNSVSGNTFNFTLTCYGDYNWSTPFQLRAVTHINRLLLPSNEPAIVVNVKISGKHVLVMAEGLSVFDLATGKLLWTTSYDMVQASTSSQEIGRTPMPIADNNAVYICDFSKGEKTIKKLNINTGSVIWENVKLNKNDVISDLAFYNNTLLVKYGGFIRKAKNVYNPNDGSTTYRANYEYEGTSNIKGIDVNNGTMLWDFNVLYPDEKFSKSECSMLMEGKNIATCSPKNIYLLNPSTGATVQKAALDKAIGSPENIYSFGSNLIVEGKEGIASYSQEGCKQNYATNTGQTLMIESLPNSTIVWTGKSPEEMNEFINFDLSNGKIYGTLKGCMYPNFDVDGDSFIRFNGSTMTRYKTK